MANALSSEKEWEEFSGRLIQLIARFRDKKDATGTFARRLEREIAHLWVERILTLRQTCRLRSLKTYPILVDAVRCYFKEQEPDLSWVAQH